MTLYNNPITQFVLLSGRAGDQIVCVDGAVYAPLNITPRAVAPTSPATNDIYFDDGTNTGSADPGLMYYDGAVWQDFLDDSTIFPLLAGRAGDKIIMQDHAANAVMNITARAAEPSAPVTGDVYLDDGTNTTSTDLGFRTWTGAAWEDIVG